MQFAKKMFSISNYVHQMSLASFCSPKKIQTLTLFILQACLFSTGLISVVQLIQAQANEEKNREISTGKQRLWRKLN